MVYFSKKRFRVMPQDRNLIAAVLAIVAGTLLVVSGTRGPIGIYQFILQKLPSIINNELLLSIVGAIALVLIIISLLGGFIVIVAGYLIYRGHGTTGKLLIGLGAGAGIPWLVLILLTLVTAQDPSSVLALHSAIGWMGIITALAARFLAK
jgi:hypothetical protein